MFATFQTNFAKVESLLVDDSGSEDGNNKSLANVLRSTETNILGKVIRIFQGFISYQNYYAKSWTQYARGSFKKVGKKIQPVLQRMRAA